MDAENNRTNTVESQLAIEAHGAEAICLGFTGMSGLEKQLAERLGVPVTDLVAAAMKIGGSLVSLGKLTSKQLTYRAPEVKMIRGDAPHFQSQNLR